MRHSSWLFRTARIHDDIGEHWVAGLVLDPVAGPREGLFVKAFRKGDSGAFAAIGADVTGQRGEYSIGYGGVSGASPTLLVRVYAWEEDPARPYDFETPCLAELELVAAAPRARATIGLSAAFRPARSARRLRRPVNLSRRSARPAQPRISPTEGRALPPAEPVSSLGTSS
ncbi:MAG: hypothetical protein U0271_30160 [Polyangiaceae bacterium]